MSFLRKQESRLLCACQGVLAGQAGTRECALDSRFRGNDTPQPASPSRGRGGLLHSANLTVSTGTGSYQM